MAPFVSHQTTAQGEKNPIKVLTDLTGKRLVQGENPYQNSDPWDCGRSGIMFVLLTISTSRRTLRFGPRGQDIQLPAARFADLLKGARNLRVVTSRFRGNCKTWGRCTFD